MAARAWTVDEREVPGAQRQLDLSQPLEDEVEGVEGQPSQPPFGARALGGVDDVRSVAPLVEQPGNQLRGSCRSPVHQARPHRPPPGRCASGHGTLQAEVARQADHHQAGLGAGALDQSRPGGVAAAVVDGDDLERRTDRAQDGENAVEQRVDDGLLVVEGHHHAQQLGDGRARGRAREGFRHSGAEGWNFGCGRSRHHRAKESRSGSLLAGPRQGAK